MANCTWVMLSLPWPASSPTSSLTTSYCLIYCGLDNDIVLSTYTHTHTHVHKPACVLKCSWSTSNLHFQKEKRMSLVFLWFFILHFKGTKTETHVVSHVSLCHADPSGKMASCVGGDVVPQVANFFHDTHCTSYCLRRGRRSKTVELVVAWKMKHNTLCSHMTTSY